MLQEIQNRCLDKLLCPRQRKMKVDVNPEDLIPDVPKRSELKPFPEFQNTLFEGMYYSTNTYIYINYIKTLSFLVLQLFQYVSVRLQEL